MVLVPDEVKCAVCRSIFCCLDCRNRHEQKSHSPNDVWTERNRLKCGLCQGFPMLEFCNCNDFALIMHLCQNHLPLHCKKCLTKFNSIGDFSTANKCAHLNDVCSLQSPLQSNHHYHSPCENHSTSSTTDVSDINYVTAVQRSSFERSQSDSVLSLRNYSTILHTSNHPLYKTQSPVVLETALVRQTSTPMHHNLAIGDTAPPSLQLQPLSHPNGSSCSRCLGASSSSGQLSCINSSSDSDTSINNAVTKPNDVHRLNIQQQNIMMTAFKRSRKSPTVTPLKRHVMTKSIQRAILEYQHKQNLSAAISPKSPLDLRVRTAICRGRNGTPVKCFTKTEHRHDKSLKINSNGHTSASLSMSSSITSTTTKVTTVMTAQDHSSRLPNTLETVYEQEKDANADILESDESNGENDDGLLKCDPIAETPILLSHRKSSDTTGVAENFDASEIWYTPKEFVQTEVIENIEIFTPKVSKKRVTARRVDDCQQQSLDTKDDRDGQDTSTSITSKLSGSKLWSFVSSFLRFATTNPRNNLSMQETKTKDNESPGIIRRCASFGGVLSDKNVLESSDDEGNQNYPLQPIKRRRITSIDPKSLDRMAIKYRKRIMCRPPIRRLSNII